MKQTLKSNEMNSFKVIVVILFYIGYAVNCETTTSTVLSNLTIKASDSDANITSVPLLPEESSIVQEIAKIEKQKNETTSTTTQLPNTNAVQQEHNNSMAIFFVLCVIALGIRFSVFNLVILTKQYRFLRNFAHPFDVANRIPVFTRKYCCCVFGCTHWIIDQLIVGPKHSQLETRRSVFTHCILFGSVTANHF